MHRMRFSTVVARTRRVLFAGCLTLSVAAAFAGKASADLIRPTAGRAYPDIAADINGSVNYSYDTSSQTGNFQVTNTPYLLAGGPSPSDEFAITPDAEGIRKQIVNIALDHAGNLVASAGNSYELWGTVQAGGQTFTGLLLKGVPTAFGSQFQGPMGSQGSAIFDLDISVTGGALASAFGKDAYMSIQPEIQITFSGSFTDDFSAAKATSNTRAYHAPLPFPAPEPTTLALLVAGGAVILYLRRRAGGANERGPRALRGDDEAGY
jgi:PEP-CTERM motif